MSGSTARLARVAAVSPLAARRAVLAEDEQLLVTELRALSYDVSSVWDLVNNEHSWKRRFIGPYPAAYPVLVRHFALPHHRLIREGIVRSLTVRNGGDVVADALLTGFQLEQDSQLR